jgi:hypothetical protein
VQATPLGHADEAPAPPGKTNDPRSKVALAAGGFILVRREVYDKIGGGVAEGVQKKTSGGFRFRGLEM